MNIGSWRRLLTILPAVVALVSPGCDGRDGSRPGPAAKETLLVSGAAAIPAFAPVPDQGRLHNGHVVTAKVISGAQPEGEASFRALGELGVKTIISVDGAQPDVAGAKQFGMRYVHLPIGYD